MQLAARSVDHCWEGRWFLSPPLSRDTRAARRRALFRRRWARYFFFFSWSLAPHPARGPRYKWDAGNYCPRAWKVDLGDPLSTALKWRWIRCARLIVAEVTRTRRRQRLGESFFSGLHVEGNLFRQHYPRAPCSCLSISLFLLFSFSVFLLLARVELVF